MSITPDALRVALGGGGDDVVLDGRLFARVKAEACVWFIGARRLLLTCCVARAAGWRPPQKTSNSNTQPRADDGMVTLQLLKASRRGHYAAGATNADTWWRSLLAGAPPSATLPGAHPPASYYSSRYEAED